MIAVVWLSSRWEFDDPIWLTKAWKPMSRDISCSVICREFCSAVWRQRTPTACDLLPGGYIATIPWRLFLELFPKLTGTLFIPLLVSLLFGFKNYVHHCFNNKERKNKRKMNIRFMSHNTCNLFHSVNVFDLKISCFRLVGSTNLFYAFFWKGEIPSEFHRALFNLIPVCRALLRKTLQKDTLWCKFQKTKLMQVSFVFCAVNNFLCLKVLCALTAQFWRSIFTAPPEPRAHIYTLALTFVLSFSIAHMGFVCVCLPINLMIQYLNICEPTVFLTYDLFPAVLWSNGACISCFHVDVFINNNPAKES